MMEIFSIAGGSSVGGDEDVFMCCGLFPLLPLVVVLALYAEIRNSVRSALLSFLLTGIPCALLLLKVAEYEPSAVGDAISDQNTGIRAMWLYAALTAIAGLSLFIVAGRRLIRRQIDGAQEAEPNSQSS